MQHPTPRDGAASSPITERAAHPPSLFRRFIAFVFDAGLLVFVPLPSSWEWGPAVYVIYASIFVVYVATTTAAVGTTLGKAFLGLRVQRRDGGRLRWGTALLRTALGYPASCTFLLGFVYALRPTSRGRAWHDELFGSEVVAGSALKSLLELGEGFDRLVKRVMEWGGVTFAWARRLNRLRNLVLAISGWIATLQRVAEWLERWLPESVRQLLSELGGRSEAEPTRSAGSVLVAAGLSTVTVAGLAAIAVDLSALRQTELGMGVEVTLTWDGRADLDLHVEDPSGTVVWSANPRVPSGGSLVQGNGCLDSSGPGVEQVLWPAGNAPAGRYRLWVHYARICGDPGPVDWEVVVRSDGVEQTFAGTLEPDAKARSVTFTH